METREGKHTWDHLQQIGGLSATITVIFVSEVWKACLPKILYVYQRIHCWGYREMSQQSRAFAILIDDPDPTPCPCTHMMAQAICNSSYKGSSALFLPYIYTHHAHTLMHIHTQIVSIHFSLSIRH